MKNVNKILDKLETIYPDAQCELEYTTAFELLIATILSAQCTDVRVNIVTRELFKKYNTAEDFANLSEEEIMGEIRTCGLYKSKAKKIKEASQMICSNYNGKVPDTLEELIKLPGVGRKTADVVLSNAFNKFALMEAIPKHRWSHSHHVLIFHGRRMCKARKPECEICLIKDDCDFYQGKE